MKDPQTGKRLARPNPVEQWESVGAPHLRIVDDALWIKVKSRQQLIKEKQSSGTVNSRGSEKSADNRLNKTHRPRFLLSGLLKCGCCGSGYTIVAQDRYGCATRRQKGTCDNSRTIKRQDIESRVLDGLKDRLLEPDLVAKFVEDFQAAEKQQLKDKHREARAQINKLNAVSRKISAILTAIEDGMYHPSMKQRLADLEAQKLELAKADQHGNADNVEALLSPNIPQLYRKQVQELEDALDDGSVGNQAKELIRSMIDRVVLAPNSSDKGLDAVLYGDLAEILNACAAAKGTIAPKNNSLGKSQFSVVAGARNRHCLLWEAAVNKAID